jgi:hypothetical protein
MWRLVAALGSLGSVVACGGIARGDHDPAQAGGSAGAFASGGTGTPAGGKHGFGNFVAPKASCEGDYLACGCGCCEDLSDSRQATCYYPEYGDSLAAIIAEDTRIKSQASCANAGCERGKRHVCCVSAPPLGKGLYDASYSGPDSALIRIIKSDAEAGCSDFTLSLFGKASLSSLASHGFNWMGGAHYSPCGVVANAPRAIGVTGDISSRANASTCLLDVHVTVFYGLPAGDVQPVRFDVDGLDAGLMAYECPH